LFVLGVAVIALHVLDDSFVQPSPGTLAITSSAASSRWPSSRSRLGPIRVCAAVAVERWR